MIVELITTGEEVLSGQIVDTNASWMSEVLRQAGLAVSRKTTVGDRLEDLVQVFLERSAVADAIVVNGGLGPTVDDLSAEAAALALEEPLVTFPEWVAALTARFERMGRVMAPRNLKQALLPQSATIIPNPVGTACGFRIRLGRALLYFTPGVPHEMKQMVRDEIIPDLRTRFQIAQENVLRRLHCFGISESRLDTLLAPVQLSPGITLGFRAHLPTTEIKIMGTSDEKGPALAFEVERVTAACRDMIGSSVQCEDDETLAGKIQEAMIAKGWRLALAESCTGGMVANHIVEQPGSSAYFQYGFVTYADEAKKEMLGVPQELLTKHGAVSIPVARAMAEGARQKAKATHGLAISGIAGPAGGTDAKPVGTVAFSLATPEGSWSQQIKLPDWGRTSIRKVSAALALDMLRRYLEGHEILHGHDFSPSVTREIVTREAAT